MIQRLVKLIGMNISKDRRIKILKIDIRDKNGHTIKKPIDKVMFLSELEVYRKGFREDDFSIVLFTYEEME